MSIYIYLHVTAYSNQISVYSTAILYLYTPSDRAADLTFLVRVESTRLLDTRPHLAYRKHRLLLDDRAADLVAEALPLAPRSKCPARGIKSSLIGWPSKKEA